MKNNLEIILIYRSNEGREIDYKSIIDHEDVMDLEDYDPGSFWQTMGGFEITLDGYKTIFRSTSFYNMVKAVSFLLHSIYKIKNISCDWFDDDEFVQNQIVHTFNTNEVFILRVMDNGFLTLTYIPSDEDMRYERGKHYFKDEVIAIDSWVVQAEIALQEYFEFLERVILDRPESAKVQVMKEFLSVFNNIKSKKSQ